MPRKPEKNVEETVRNVRFTPGVSLGLTTVDESKRLNHPEGRVAYTEYL
jgi:hypothetical protein